MLIRRNRAAVGVNLLVCGVSWRESRRKGVNNYHFDITKGQKVLVTFSGEGRLQRVGVVRVNGRGSGGEGGQEKWC